MTTTSDPGMLSPLSQFWTSPIVIAKVDRAPNEKAALTSKDKGHSSIAEAGQQNVRSTMPKRDPKLSFKLRSPYVTRAITFDVIFPAVEPLFYYIVVFDLKRPSISIIDSENRAGKVDDIYGSRTVVLQYMMIMHLLKEGHGAWKVYTEMDQDNIKTRWQFRENTVDCGVMLMRHMETFFRGDIVKWDCRLYKESTK
ncbi:hypothetical protein Ccrd_026334 [Cynara cardunculus var. scolymus]|uniref:Peptidase C48, SUMO/Sentrin/Ubl1 n=1 Tax=Cynara cardunculus var. scolymus TaxID=59895 RepID=A0A118HPA8_CYNCS|nr:hypothetical protein Ccrd_026334 [Cynara cardunculus var. scolymus]